MNITEAILKIERLELDKHYQRKHIDSLQERLDSAFDIIESTMKDRDYWKGLVADIAAEYFDEPVPEVDEEWDETRVDQIGQNGNTGEHYREFLK